MLAKHHTRNQSKSVATDNMLPVGHPGRYQRMQQNGKSMACTLCDKRFDTGKDIENHMIEHEGEANEGFQTPREEKICRYFRNGFCYKGEQCVFKHIKTGPPACKRGQKCIFFYQNRCRFSHEGSGIQEKQKECRYKERCWDLSTCKYLHRDQDFQYVKQTNRPPQGVRNMNIYQNY